MKWYRVFTLSTNKQAVLGQPIYLLVVIIIVAAIIGILALSLQQIIISTQIHQIEHELNRITTEATNMFEYADEGTVIELHIDLPTSLRYIVFGALPINGTVEPSLLTLNDTTSNNYYFVMNDGTIHSYHLNARFSNKNFTQMVVLHAGVYDLTLEVCSHEGKTYVTID